MTGFFSHYIAWLGMTPGAIVTTVRGILRHVCGDPPPASWWTISARPAACWPPAIHHRNFLGAQPQAARLRHPSRGAAPPGWRLEAIWPHLSRLSRRGPLGRYGHGDCRRPVGHGIALAARRIGRRCPPGELPRMAAILGGIIGGSAHGLVGWSGANCSDKPDGATTGPARRPRQTPHHARLIFAHDLGTTGNKATLYSPAGKLVASLHRQVIPPTISTATGRNKTGRLVEGRRLVHAGAAGPGRGPGRSPWSR